MFIGCASDVSARFDAMWGLIVVLMLERRVYCEFGALGVRRETDFGPRAALDTQSVDFCGAHFTLIHAYHRVEDSI